MPATRRNCICHSAASPAPASRMPARRRKVRPHEQRQRKQQARAAGRREAIARTGAGAADEQQEACEEAHIGRRIAEAARRPFHVEHEARTEQHADRDGGERQRKRERPARRQEAPEQRKHQHRQEHHEREIAEIALAEDHVLEGAQVAHAGREVEHALLPAQRAVDVAGQQILQHRPRIAVVDQAIVAGIERTHAADEARIVEEHDDQA